MYNVIFFIFLCFILTSCVIQSNPGNGVKIGRIVRLSKQGLIFKTWEGELIRGGLNDGSGNIGSSFYFTIEDESLAKIAMECLENQIEVKIEYEIEFISNITRSEKSEPHFVKRIRY